MRTNGAGADVKACGPDTPTLVSSGQNDLLATGAKEPGPRGERDISRKTIAQGRPDVSANPWFLTRVLSTLHTRLRVH